MVRARGLVVLTVATMVAFACGNTGGGGGSKGEIDIASDLPTSGADASSGLPTQYGAAFAVSQAGSLKGFTLKFVPFDDAVNVTLGLPFIRTSPDHGTAFDIAGSGRANPASLIAALRLAARMA